jgi:pimeloyl-ACP methyl ester carboxylesterase
MSVLNHPLITARYFFPRKLAVANPTWVGVEHARLACYATRSGHPLTVVHFHGNGEVVADYVPEFVEMLEVLGADCFLSEYRGYGASGGVPRLGEMLDDVEAIFEAVGRRPEEIIVFGRSLGSIYAIEFAHRYPDVAGLVLESAIADPLERILMRVTPTELGMSLSAIESEFRERLDHLAKLRVRRKPTLIMHTKNDVLVDASHAVRLSSGPIENVRLVLFPHGDHNTIFPENRERYVDELRELIEVCARGETRYAPASSADDTEAGEQ